MKGFRSESIAGQSFKAAEPGESRQGCLVAIGEHLDQLIFVIAAQKRDVFALLSPSNELFYDRFAIGPPVDIVTNENDPVVFYRSLLEILFYQRINVTDFIRNLGYEHQTTQALLSLYKKRTELRERRNTMHLVPRFQSVIDPLIEKYGPKLAPFAQLTREEQEKFTSLYHSLHFRRKKALIYALGYPKDTAESLISLFNSRAKLRNNAVKKLRPRLFKDEKSRNSYDVQLKLDTWRCNY